MVIRAESQVEPIPGYRLMERLGAGGFGEVWKAEAPGGLHKAIKFVHGTLHGNHSEDGPIHQELKALNRVKTVRHPYILSLERYDIIDGQLLIVMELADRNLWDRYRECADKGLPGIPRDELLRYLEETAEALDLMNIDYQLQHLDIKPQNLFLIHHHVKVADFGLVKTLEGMNTQVSSGVTPVYAAPETFNGLVSRGSDQYSLAIVYQELLTGQRPFNGTNYRQLLVQHTNDSPDLTSLSEADRGPIGRALSKKPEDRFPTCAELVQAIRQGGVAARAMDQEPVSIETPPVMRMSPTRQAERPFPAPAAPAMTIPPVAAPSATVAKKFLPPITTVPPREEITGDGVLFPAMVIGLGRLGLQVVQQLRTSLHDRCGPPDFLPQLRLLYIDTDLEAAARAADTVPESALEQREVIAVPLNKPGHYLKTVRNRATLDSWLNLAMICRLPRNQTTTEGLRILGRLGLVDNYRTVISRLRSELEACVNPKALGAAQRQTQLGVRTNRPRIYIVAGLGGGTGGGMFIDVAYMVREQLRRLGFTRFDVVGLFFLPSADSAAKQSPALANTFAALTELHHFSSPEVRYQAFFDDSEEPIHDAGAPFGRCIMLPLPTESRDPKEGRHATAFAADLLCRELISPMGRKADDARAALAESSEGSEMLCQTFGAQRFALPRRVLRDQIANVIGVRLVESWTAMDRSAMPQAVAGRLADSTTGIDLRAETVMGQLKTACERGLARPAEVQFQAILQRCLGQGDDTQTAAVLDAMGQIEHLVGRPTGGAGPTLLGDALARAADSLRREQGQRLGDLLAGLVEEPNFRIGGAEEACQQIDAAIRLAGQEQLALYREWSAKAADTHSHIHGLICNLQKGSWWPGRKTKMAVELRRTLETFPRTRYQGLAVESLVSLYRGLLDDLPKQQKELTFARERLGQFQRLLREELITPGSAKLDLGPGRHLFPAGSRSFDDAVDALTRSIPMDTLIEIDRKAQPLIRRQFRSLLQLCLGPPTAFQDLWTVLTEQVKPVADGLIGKTSVAEFYLKSQANDAAASGDLAAAFDEAAPALAGRRSTLPEIRLVVVPTDRAGERLGRLAKDTLGDVEILTITGTDDVYFYREQSRLPLAELPQLGLIAEEAYRRTTASGQFTPHTRIDVPHWLPVV